MKKEAVVVLVVFVVFVSISIGFCSGLYFSSKHPNIIAAVQNRKEVINIINYGSEMAGFLDAMRHDSGDKKVNKVLTGLIDNFDNACGEYMKKIGEE